jgi:hypothetical protein
MNEDDSGKIPRSGKIQVELLFVTGVSCVRDINNDVNVLRITSKESDKKKHSRGGHDKEAVYSALERTRHY